MCPHTHKHTHTHTLTDTHTGMHMHTHARMRTCARAHTSRWENNNSVYISPVASVLPAKVSEGNQS